MENMDAYLKGCSLNPYVLPRNPMELIAGNDCYFV